MQNIPCLLIDDDPEEHEIFQMALEAGFDGSSCYFATDIFSALSGFQEAKFAQPEVIFVDWSVIKADPAAHLSLLRSAFPLAADRMILLSGEIPLIDQQRLGLYQVLRKPFSLDAYSQLIAYALRTKMPRVNSAH